MSSAPLTEQALAGKIPRLLLTHPVVGAVSLTGSRARGEATELSDWDFKIETRDFRAVAQALPELVAGAAGAAVGPAERARMLHADAARNWEG
jgi:predicted nucleotidyltransferase